MAHIATNENSRPAATWRWVGWSAAGLLLVLPLVAMQFTDDVNWNLADFVIFGALLLSAGVALELAVRISGDAAYRLAAGLAIGTAFLLVWANGAVGIIGEPGSTPNLVLFGIPVVALVGALLARFRSRAMGLAMIATGVAQMLVAAIALLSSPAHGSVAEILMANGVFAGLFLGAAWLFNVAARNLRQSPS